MLVESFIVDLAWLVLVHRFTILACNIACLLVSLALNNM
jgi:hypothetical protein